MISNELKRIYRWILFSRRDKNMPIQLVYKCTIKKINYIEIYHMVVVWLSYQMIYG